MKTLEIKKFLGACSNFVYCHVSSPTTLSMLLLHYAAELLLEYQSVPDAPYTTFFQNILPTANINQLLLLLACARSLFALTTLRHHGLAATAMHMVFQGHGRGEADLCIASMVGSQSDDRPRSSGSVSQANCETFTPVDHIFHAVENLQRD